LIGDERGGFSLEVKKQIRDFILKNALSGSTGIDLDDEDSFLEKEIIDSTGVLELVSFVEERFGIEVNDDELIPDNFDSVSKLNEYVKKKQDA
ncbi:MAG TPA: acyl carrier protein, partial [Candidatus Krumholzibacteriaceae bacterium]